MKLRFGIRTKLIGMINMILLVAAAIIIAFATTLFSNDSETRIQDANLQTARVLAEQVKNNFLNLTEKMRLMGITSMQTLPPEALEALTRPFYESEKDFLGQSVVRIGGGPPKQVGHSLNDVALKSLDIPTADVLRLHERLRLDKLLAGAETLETGQLKGGVPVITIGLPLVSDDKGNVSHVVVATLKMDRFIRAFQSTTQGIISSFLVDSEGYLLAHPDQRRVLKHESVVQLKIVKEMLAAKNPNGQTSYVDPQNGIEFLGAFTTVPFAGIGVISQVDKAKAFEAARKVKTTSIIITAMVSIVAFLIVFFFSLSLTRPLVKLVDATRQIVSGNYNISLKRRANDEIGDLTRAFGDMAQGLAERDRVKATFAKFHSKEMAEKVLSGELKLGGERRSATVFFSDVRGFTALSEGMDPEALVTVLNRYMSRMVHIILENHGIVDKYVGDAIMAVWGVPLPHEHDVENAVRACIGMRTALAELNEELKAEAKPLLKIGMGLNFGPLIAGNIGSNERMEYTVIGDTVNTASRIESLTKEFGTDFLISQAVLDQLGGKFVVEKAHEAKVKGKSEPLVVYKVHGYIDEAGNQVIVETPYSSYAAEKSDKVVHDDQHPAPAEHSADSLTSASGDITGVLSILSEATSVGFINPLDAGPSLDAAPAPAPAPISEAAPPSGFNFEMIDVTSPGMAVPAPAREEKSKIIPAPRGSRTPGPKGATPPPFRGKKAA